MLYHLLFPNRNTSYNCAPYSSMIISTENYRETFFLKPDITVILGIPTYYDLHKMKLEIKPMLFMFTPTSEVPLTDVLDSL